MYHLKSVCITGHREIFILSLMLVYIPLGAQHSSCWVFYWATWQHKNKVHKLHLQSMEPNKVKKKDL